jgi:nucleoside-diphosphate-sugar epimerase
VLGVKCDEAQSLMSQHYMLVTGSNGFVDRALCAEALACGMAVRGVTRAPWELPAGVENFAVGGIDGNTDW